MKIYYAIVGSRTFKGLELVKRFVAMLPLDAAVVTGGAMGPDKTAENAARARELEVQVITADWQMGKHAGMVRNAKIIRKSDKLVAFWNGESAGTRQTIELARKEKMPILIIYEDGRMEREEPEILPEQLSLW